MILQIIRIEQTPGGTLGVLKINGKAFCVTLELPYKDNKADQSCIPEGNYFCERFLSPKFGGTYQVKNVPGRSGILFHAGNVAEDTKGCILLGASFVNLKDDKRAIVNSGNTFKKFMETVGSKYDFVLNIKSCLT
jgi:hypothetical protein